MTYLRNQTNLTKLTVQTNLNKANTRKLKFRTELRRLHEHVVLASIIFMTSLTSLTLLSLLI